LEKAFTLLLNSHPGLLYKVCHLYCQDPEDRKDLFQEIILQLWKAFPSFQHASKASTWMYRIALNTAITYRRKQVRQPKLLPLPKQVFQVPDLAEQPDFLEEAPQLMAAIERLSPVEKALVMLYLEEKSYEEMAALLGISKSNVGVKLSRVKTKLENLLNLVNP
jgi:RNA polymerase sigma factor (sigma-70 family)